MVWAFSFQRDYSRCCHFGVLKCMSLSISFVPWRTVHSFYCTISSTLASLVSHDLNTCCLSFLYYTATNRKKSHHFRAKRNEKEPKLSLECRERWALLGKSCVLLPDTERIAPLLLALLFTRQPEGDNELCWLLLGILLNLLTGPPDTPFSHFSSTESDTCLSSRCGFWPFFLRMQTAKELGTCKGTKHMAKARRKPGRQETQKQSQGSEKHLVQITDLLLNWTQLLSLNRAQFSKRRWLFSRCLWLGPALKDRPVRLGSRK